MLTPMPTPFSKQAIQPREKLDFQLTADIPRFWNGGDPFKTRFFDAMSLTFPIGERYFISTVRAYRDQVQDPHLLQEVKDFMRQEGQHGMVHTQFNKLVEGQGVNVPWFERFLSKKFELQLKYWPKSFNLAYTAAAEHLTAMMCSTFMEREAVMGTFDPRIRAMYTWHMIEEVEHKAVAYDVLTKVARANYFTRVLAMIYFSIEYPIGTALTMNRMFKADGFGFFKRAGMWLRGMWWFYKPGGVFAPALGYYLSYYKPGFHPWQHQEQGHYDVWLQSFNATGDPIRASNDVASALRALPFSAI
ncbi:MAG: metal-dependent hydrolase [Hydrogenophaga sp.]|nr:metal-dependent hydrolase [Hydrogenophaga sp.]